MAKKTYLTPSNVGIQEYIYGQTINIGDYSETDLDTFLTGNLVGGYTRVQFNALSNPARHEAIKGLFGNTTLAKGITFSGSSIKYGSTTIGTDSGSIQEGTAGNDNVQMTLIHANSNELTYGYCCDRYRVGASTYAESEWVYTDIYLHNSGFDPSTLNNTYQWLSRYLELPQSTTGKNVATGLYVNTTSYNRANWTGTGNTPLSSFIYGATRYYDDVVSSFYIASATYYNNITVARHIYTTLINPSSSSFEIRIGFNQSYTTQALIRLNVSGGYWRIQTDYSSANQIYAYTSSVAYNPFSFIEFIRDDIEDAIYLKLNGTKVYIKKNATGQPNMTDAEFTTLCGTLSGGAKDLIIAQNTTNPVYIYDVNHWAKAFQGNDASKLTAWGMRWSSI